MTQRVSSKTSSLAVDVPCCHWLAIEGFCEALIMTWRRRGCRLLLPQTSEAVRARATDAMDIVQFLQEFSVTPADFSDLSELFSDDKRMAEAAVRERELAGSSTPAMLFRCCCCSISRTARRH